MDGLAAVCNSYDSVFRSIAGSVIKNNHGVISIDRYVGLPALVRACSVWTARKMVTALGASPSDKSGLKRLTSNLTRYKMNPKHPSGSNLIMEKVPNEGLNGYHRGTPKVCAQIGTVGKP